MILSKGKEAINVIQIGRNIEKQMPKRCLEPIILYHKDMDKLNLSLKNPGQQWDMARLQLHLIKINEQGLERQLSH